jgi:hypothetical protein
MKKVPADSHYRFMAWVDLVLAWLLVNVALLVLITPVKR